MKKILYVFIICFAFFIIACSNSVNNNVSDNSIPEGYGKLILSINVKTDFSRTAIPLENLASNVSQYHVYVFNSSSSMDAVFSETTNQTMIIPAGTYNSVVIGGTDLFVFGSGFQKGIEIKSGKKTEVNYILKPFDYSISCDSEIVCGEDYEVSFSLNTRNEMLYFSGVMLCQDNNKPYTYNDEKLVEYSGSLSFTAPTLVGSGKIEMSPQYLVINDTESQYTKSTNLGFRGWTYENMENISWRKINFIEGDSEGIKINITWEQ